MIKIIGFEIKRTVFSVKFLIIMIFAVLLNIGVIVNYNSKDEQLVQQMSNSIYTNYLEYESLYQMTKKESLKTAASIEKKIYDSLINKEWNVYYRALIERFLGNARFLIKSNKNEAEFEYYAKELGVIANELNENIEMGYEIENNSNIRYIYNAITQSMFNMNNQIPIITQYTINSNTYSYQYLRVIMPISLILMCVIFAFELVHEDRRNGIIKVFMSSGKKRMNYILIKSISYSCVVIISILIPFVLFQGGYMMKECRINTNFLVSSYEKGFSTTLDTTAYYEQIHPKSSAAISDKISYSGVSQIGLLSINDSKNIAIFPHGIKEESKFVVHLYALFVHWLTALMIGFAVVAIQMIFKNFMISNAVMWIYFVMGFLLLLIQKADFSFFGGFDILAIIEGRNHVTYFQLVCLLIFGSCIGLISNCIIVKRIDFE